MSKRLFGLFEFESNKEKYSILAIIGVLIFLIGITIYPSLGMYLTGMAVGEANIEKSISKQTKTPKEYYDMFKCPCCGQPIDSNCCGMAKERKDYLDKLLLEDLEENEVVYRMAKEFGFSVLKDQSKEQEIKEYMKSKAPDNPPKIAIENTRYDFGTISQKNGNISTIFTVRNTGGSDLVIDNMDSSCMCTSASLIYKGVEGPRFGMNMHGGNPKGWSQIIKPGESAQLKVYYDPMAHGIQKEPEQKIIREITIVSNDPIDFQKKVRVELTQVP